MATAKRERAEEILGELAELSLMLARDLAVHAREAEDAEEKVALAAAFQKMAPFNLQIFVCVPLSSA